MNFIKNYKSFLESIVIDISVIQLDINESLGMVYDSIFKSIGAEEVEDVYSVLNLPKEDWSSLDLDFLNEHPEFIHSLSSLGLKKSKLTNTDEFETFLNKPCRFFLIHKIEANEDLENPDFILIQSLNEPINKWETTKMYKLNGDIKNFYDKLSSKKIVVDDDGKEYIYSTSNGNEWNLENQDLSDDIYKNYFRKDEFEKLINGRNVTIRII